MKAKLGIQQTLELLVAAGSVLRDSLAANEDGKITKWEAAQIGMRNLGKIVEGFGGIGQVIAEMQDLTVDEVDSELYPPVMAELGWTNHHRAKNIFDDIFHWLRGTLITFHSLRNTISPPVAVVIPENLPGGDPP